MRLVTFAECFGWLHQASDSRLGVVMCASWEYEAAAVGQTWRVFADRLANAGLPTLRFDYPGCGDSLGTSEAPGAFDNALASISAAAETLRAQAGVDRIALVGHRLGAALALMAAETLDAEAVALIRPVVRGKTFVAEQRALSRILQAREGVAVRRDSEPGVLVVEGFRLSPESLERIGKIDLTGLKEPGPKRVLIAGEPCSAQYDVLNDSLVARGASVTRYDLSEVAGWAPALIPVEPPLADCDSISSWLQVDAESRVLRPISKTRWPTESAALRTGSFQEAAIAFGPAQSLTGILCRPARTVAGAASRAVVFLNTGANSHIGAGRTAVLHARDLAEFGIASFRIDIKGLGDSAWTMEGPLSAIHYAERAADVSAAIDVLKGKNYDDITLVGICSGAFLAFQCALNDSRVDRVLLANPQFWLQPSAQQIVDSMDDTYGSFTAYTAMLFKKETWQRIFDGHPKIARDAQILSVLTARAFKRTREAVQRASSVLFRPEPKGSELSSLLAKLKARDCEAMLVLSEGDPARGILEGLLPGVDFGAVEGLRIIDAHGADHTFVMPRTRNEFFRLICDCLEPRVCVPGRHIAVDPVLTEVAVSCDGLRTPARACG